MRKLSFIFLIFIVPILVYGVNYTDYVSGGYRVQGGNNGLLSLFSNPVVNPGVWWDKQKVLVNGAFEIAIPTEIRTENVFDSYSNAIGERTVYYGQNIYVYPSLAWASMLVNKYLRIQAGYSVLYNDEYTYEKIEYDGYYVPIYSNEIYSMGRIENWGAQIVSGWNDMAVLGVGVYYIFGKPYFKETRTYLPTGEIEDQSEIFVTKIYGYMFNLGGWAKITDRIKMFYSYDVPFSLEYTYDVYSYDNGIRQIDSVAQEKDISIPGVARMGMEFIISNKLPTTINFQADYYFNNAADSTQEDVLNYGLTIRHLMKQDTYFYYGFKWDALSLNNSVARIEVLGGIQFALNKSVLLLGGGYRYTSFYGDQLDMDDTYHHEERDFFLTTGVTINIAE